MFITPAFAQSNLIMVQTDDNEYEEGDVIVVSGQVSTIIASTDILLTITSEGRLVEVGQIVVAQDGSYLDLIKTSDRWIEGEYVVVASYGDERAETRFTYSPKIDPSETTDIFEVGAGSSGTFDVGYTINGGIVKDMRIDEKNLALVVTIESADKGTLSLDLPRSAIDAKKSDQSDEVFIALIDDIDINYEESTGRADSRVITINFEKGDSEIMIIGTWVIPEFGTLAMLVLVAMLATVVFLTKNKIRL